ncbi:MAG: oligosaccharide flippase family protein [Bacillota bacterium]|nr:oligosaccharide flippase family protein [Bacillota bacterium]
MRLNEIKTGAILSYILLILTIVISIGLTPFILHHIGQSQYGLFAVVGAFVSYISVMDFGLSNTIIRYIAKYKAEDNENAIENFLFMCLAFYIFITVILAGLGAIFYFKIDVLFGKSFNPTELSLTRKLFILMLANLAITLVYNAFIGILSGYEKFIYQRGMNIIKTILRNVFVVVFLLLGYKIISIVVIDTVFNVILFGLVIYYSLVVLKVKIKFHYFDKPLFKEVFAFSFFIFLAMVVDQFYWRLGQIVIGAVSGTVASTIYAMGIQFPIYYLTFSTAISTMLLPRATKLSAKNASHEELTDFMITTGRIQLEVLGFLLLAFAFVGKQFLMVWLGPGYDNAWIVGILIMVTITVPLAENTTGTLVLQAKNKHAFRSVLYLIIAGVNLVITIFFAKKWGVIGASLGTIVSFIIGNIIIINIYYKAKIGINILRYFKQLIKGIIPAFIITSGIGFLTNCYIEKNTWPSFILCSLIITVAYCLSIWFIGMNSYEKEIIKKPVCSIFNRLTSIIRK